MERLEIRVDKTMRKQLSDWANAQGISLAEAIRQLIGRGLNLEDTVQQKQEAAQQLFRVELGDIPAPEILEDEIHRAIEGD